MITIYNYDTNDAVFTGTATECWDWLTDRINDAVVYRWWQEDTRYVYACGSMYYANCDVATAAQIERLLTESAATDYDYDNDESDGHLY